MAFPTDASIQFSIDNIGNRHFLIDFEYDSGTLYFTTLPNGATYNSNTYTFLGGIGSVGTVAESDQLDPADYSIVIGTADPVVLATFLNETALNRKCICREVITDDYQVFLTTPFIYFSGSMQPPSINDGDTSIIQIQVRDELADWDRNISSLYTDAEQRRLHPTDFCFENVSSLAAKEIIWPTRKWFKDNA